MPTEHVWIGIDTGGTFTDLVLFDRLEQRYHYLKLATSTDEPWQSIVDGVSNLLAGLGLETGAVELLSHGTTLGTNALLEQKLPRTGMITTAGFRDIVEIARQRRPHMFNLRVSKPFPIATRSHRLEVQERLSETGEVLVPLDESGLQTAITVLREQNCIAVAVCFLHAYANPAHEQRALELIEAAWPRVYVSISSDVLAEMREYERFSTTLVNAALRPIMDRYLARLEQQLVEIGVPVAPRIMQSNGGAVTPATVRRLPVNTCLSGPAAGVVAAVRLCERTGLRNLLTFDMGGTSTDVCLVNDGEPAMQIERTIAGLPVRTRTIDIHTVGAGGGSIAWIDNAGLLKVGPQSAGAVPGPAAYQRGGKQPTVTDANFVLGRLAEDDLLGGQMQCSNELARAAVGQLAERLGLSETETAAGVVQIVNTNMVGALRTVSIERGLDPRDFALLAYGGAGPLHAVEVASQMGITSVIVPVRPGLLSALGLLEADARADFSLTRLVGLSEPTLMASAEQTISSGFCDLYARAANWVNEEGLLASALRYEPMLDMRYVGQSFEIGVPVPLGPMDTSGVVRPELDPLAQLCGAFHTRHQELNGYSAPDQGVEVVTLRLRVVGPRPHAPQTALAQQSAVAEFAGIEVGTATFVHRQVWFEATGVLSTPVCDRALLLPGHHLKGPAVIVQMDTTMLLPPECSATVDKLGNLYIVLPDRTDAIDPGAIGVGLH